MNRVPRRTSRKKICVVTGSRSEYGLLFWILKELKADAGIILQMAVTGAHLSKKHGNTADVIEQDGFVIDERIKLDLTHDSDLDIARALGTGVRGSADAFKRLEPDILLVLGDRYEIFAAVAAAMILKIPVAHIAGGDVTEGAYDDAMRHAITKMSQIHFVTNEDAGRRVRQLGEDPAHVFVVGSPGLDHLSRTSLLGRREVESRLGLSLSEVNLLITFHPATLDNTPPREQFKQLLGALHELPSGWHFIFTRPNADAGGAEIDRLLGEFAAKRPNTDVFTSLGQQMYLSVMALSDVVIGNSSSGLYEAPSLKKPTVNIGDRQQGRLKASSVIDCEPRKSEIKKAILRAVTMDCSNAVNPYGDGRTTSRIINVLKQIDDPSALLKKHFFDLEAPSSSGRPTGLTETVLSGDSGGFVNLMKKKGDPL